MAQGDKMEHRSDYLLHKIALMVAPIQMKYAIHMLLSFKMKCITAVLDSFMKCKFVTL